MPKVALFIPCYIDQLFPRVGLATVDVLERHGVTCEFPREQTCCGQPMANTGCNDAARPLAVKFVEVFRGFDHVVCPSGSCVAMVRHHFHDLLSTCNAKLQAEYEQLAPRVFELCEYLVDVLGIEHAEGRFPHRVGLHQSCHGLRELRLARSSELNVAPFSKTRQLLETLDGIELTEPARPDECCGFGGTFAINEEAVSCLMGEDRIRDHEQAGTEVLTGNDMSCLMHLEGLLRRRKKPMRVMHVAEILAAAAGVPTGVAG